MRGFLVLCAAVLVAIGIGVAAEVAAGSSGPSGLATYGPPGHRFLAAFPVTPRSSTARTDGVEGYVLVAHAAGAFYEVEHLEAGPGAPTSVRVALRATAATLAGPRSLVLARLERTLAARSCPELGACGAWVGYAPLQVSRDQPALRIAGRRAHAFFLPGSSQGRRVTLGVAKAVVGDTFWSVSAIGPSARVHAFIRSFRPVG